MIGGLCLLLRAGGSCAAFRVRRFYGIGHRYFLWDILDAIVNFIDLGFVVHGTRLLCTIVVASERLNAGIACLAIYTMSFVRVYSSVISRPSLTLL
jgi:hypothetical protein